MTKLRVYRRNGVREYLICRVLEGAFDWFVLEEGEYAPLLLAAGEAAAALAVHRRAGIQFPGWKLAEPDSVQLIAALRKQKLWNDAVHCMNEYLKLHTERASVVRLALAQTLLEQLNRPGQALKAIAKIEPGMLDANKQQMLKSLYSKALAAAEEDPYEAVTDEC